MFATWRQLKKAGVLGINGRNADYTLPYNPRRLIPLVDDKLLTKQLAQQAGIAIPALYGVIEIQRQVRDLAHILAAYNDFVIKPAHGSGGDGILIIKGRSAGYYRRASGALMDQAGMAHHVSSILSGMYSLGGHPDKAIIEYRLKFDPIFEAISFQGVPDVRIIVFLGVPVMAMVRLPTQLSDGKGNLHQGAIGVGVDMATGRTLSAVWQNDIVTEHPDTGNPVSGVMIPRWEQLLDIAARCYALTGLGYIGADIVLDRDLGPLLLELNARPGLNIQLANRAGLRPRLRKVEEHAAALKDTASRIEFATREFAV